MRSGATRGFFIMALAVTVSISLYGCSNSAGTTSPNEGQTSAQPVILKIMKGQTGGSLDEFNHYFAEPAKKKFPNYTLEYVELQKDQTVKDLVAGGVTPDAVFTGRGSASMFEEVVIPTDLTPLIKKYKLDLNKFNKAGMSSVLPSDAKSPMTLLPYTANFYAMAYNKDIFDKFSVSYPKESMIWEDVTELAKKVTRNESGTQYFGINPGNAATLTGRGLSLRYIDPKTNKADLDNDGWKRALEVSRDMFMIPGNLPPQKELLSGLNGFYDDKNIAMLPSYTSGLVEKFQALGENNQPFDWDLTTYPSFKESPGKTAQADVNVFMISSASKHPDETFQVMAYLASDETVQTDWAKQGKLPAIDLKNVDSIYGQNYSVLKGKNVKAIFKSATREMPVFTEFDLDARAQLQKAQVDVLYNGIDVNTALRMAEDAANQVIAGKQNAK